MKKKRLSKESLARLSCIAHILIGIILADLLPSIFARILLFIAIGVIAGAQVICIKNTQFPEEQ